MYLLLHVLNAVFVGLGIVSADYENEAQRPEEASDGEVQGRGGPGLRWSGQVGSYCLWQFGSIGYYSQY